MESVCARAGQKEAVHCRGRLVMMREYPDYYEQFHCIADRCPDTCCAGWEVDLDDEAWYRYLVVKGPFGDKLRSHMQEDGAWKYFPLNERGRCPFLTERNLCEIYERLGEDALCQTCAEHPRYFIDCGSYEQVDISLGCPEAARLFFSSKEPIRYVREDGENGGNGLPPEACLETEDRCTGADVPGWESADGEQDAEDVPEQCLTVEERQRRDGILTERDRILGVLQDGNGPASYEERLRAAGIWLPVEDQEVISLARQMEPLNGDWTRRTAQMDAMIHRPEYEKEAGNGIRGGAGSTELWNGWMTRLACYLVFRYWIDAYYDGDTVPQIRLINRSLRLIALLYAADAGDGGTGMTDVTEETLQKEADAGRERMIDVVHIFSRQVEFDEANLAMMKNR